MALVNKGVKRSAAETDKENNDMNWEKIKYIFPDNDQSILKKRKIENATSCVKKIIPSLLLLGSIFGISDTQN